MVMEPVRGTETLDALNPPAVEPVQPVVEPIEPIVEPVEPIIPEPVVPEPIVVPEPAEEPIVEPIVPAVEPKEPEMISKEAAQSRIDRMYARLRAEKTSNVVAPIEVPAVEGESKPFTREEAEEVWNYKEKERKFKENEVTVLMRHPEALDNEGKFNMNDSFARSYLEIGRNNPNLGYMIDGPLLAEAMIEKTMKKPDSVAITKHNKKAEFAHTAKSTVARSAVTIVKLTDVERKIAKRMRMTDQAYLNMKTKIAKGDKRVA